MAATTLAEQLRTPAFHYGSHSLVDCIHATFYSYCRNSLDGFNHFLCHLHFILLHVSQRMEIAALLFYSRGGAALAFRPSVQPSIHPACSPPCGFINTANMMHGQNEFSFTKGFQTKVKW